MSKPYQLNISPTAEILKVIDQAVEKYGKSHRNARSRAIIAAEIVELYLPQWLDLMDARERLLREHISSGKVPAASRPAAKRA